MARLPPPEARASAGARSLVRAPAPSTRARTRAHPASHTQVVPKPSARRRAPVATRPADGALVVVRRPAPAHYWPLRLSHRRTPLAPGSLAARSARARPRAPPTPPRQAYPLARMHAVHAQHADARAIARCASLTMRLWSTAWCSLPHLRQILRQQQALRHGPDRAGRGHGPCRAVRRAAPLLQHFGSRHLPPSLPPHSTACALFTQPSLVHSSPRLACVLQRFERQPAQRYNPD